MKVRIIAGRFGGRIIDSPGSAGTHPMSERVRNAMFNKLGDTVVGARVLDAFAGSGSIGLEAISRGAASAVLIERDRRAFSALSSNIDQLGVTEATPVRASVGAWLDRHPDVRFDIIFADPPYQDVQLPVIKKLMDHLNPGGSMILSHPGRGELPTKTGVVVVDNRSYGNAALTFYRLEDASKAAK